MSSSLVVTIIALYFLVLILISYFTSRRADAQSFFTGNRQSPWYLVAFGMVGASLSGITFISVPGEVGNSQFSYFQFVLGNVVGYIVVAKVLLPLYYRMNLVSIYGYLEHRFGFWAYKMGAFFFLLSRVIGSSFRLFIVAVVLQLAVFDHIPWPFGPGGTPFAVTVFVTIALIWVYTFQGGIKTIVWTDTLQTFFLLLAVVLTIISVSQELHLGVGGLITAVKNSPYSAIFVWDWQPSTNFFKQFISGIFISIVMTGLDQDMMQKNLTCRSLGEAQKNVFSFTSLFLVVSFFFLTLGALLYLYAEAKGIALPARTDQLYPMLALHHFPISLGVVFMLGIIAAAYSSADSALTALTTSFCVDFLGFEKNRVPAEKQKRTRMAVHIGFSVLMLAVIIIFRLLNDESVVKKVFTAAGFTYGPLLGLFAFGLLSKRLAADRYIPWVCLLSPVLSYLFTVYSSVIIPGYEVGFEILIINGFITFMGLLLISKPAPSNA